MEVEIISKELIKPSSPTPQHLRHFRLSFLDQIQPQIFMPLVLFYQKNPNINFTETCDSLKGSLSEVLTILYPVAGRIRNNSYVECNDDGALFVEAKARCQLSDILRDRNVRNNNLLSPYQDAEAVELGGVFQITLFACGGVALSFGVSHKIGDAFSMHVTFPQSWAMVARGDPKINVPFGFASQYPPIPDFEPRMITSKEKLVTKLFVFGRPALAALKAKYTANGNGVRPTRVEALAAFVVSRFMIATRVVKESNKHYQVVFPVNLRPRMEPPLPSLSFGNLVTVVVAEAAMDPADDDCFRILKSMKDAMNNANAEYVKKLQNTQELLNFLRTVEKFERKSEENVSLIVSSLHSFPLYEVDFGWGKPLSLGITPTVAKNIVSIGPTRDGEGLEAFICLKEEDMAKFEVDNLLLAHVSPYRKLASPRL